MSPYAEGALIGGLFSVVTLLLTLRFKPRTEVDTSIIVHHIEEHFGNRQSIFDSQLDQRREISAKLYPILQELRSAKRAFDRLARHVSVEDDEFVVDTATALQTLSPFLVSLSTSEGALPTRHQTCLREARRLFTVVFLNLSVSKKDRENPKTKERVENALRELGTAVASFEVMVRDFTGVDELTDRPEPQPLRLVQPVK